MLGGSCLDSEDDLGRDEEMQKEGLESSVVFSFVSKNQLQTVHFPPVNEALSSPSGTVTTAGRFLGHVRPGAQARSLRKAFCTFL